MNKHPKLYRKRFIPQETIHLKDDVILVCTDTLIVTKWNTLKPRSDIAYGISAYFTDQGFKVSKIYNKNKELVYWYCDIIHINKDDNNNLIIVEDLLIDIIISNSGFVKVVDIGEVAIAFDTGLITKEQVSNSLRITDFLLNCIYNGSFTKYQDIVNLYE